MSTSMTSFRGFERDAHCMWAKRQAAYGAVAPVTVASRDGFVRLNGITLGATQPEAGEGMT